ncbi:MULTISPECIES: SDR family NAD(P)-dependent oxidoreductase [Novosphingobium]|uniref:3-oxoacyl-[acyl-carrier protein] reductase/meso-butanediol dehydrogenase / (S,S)-butanediol dehydrogenase / diacetyl reductase n=1 Tax=Novosphingobium mathurense TaxID=428990 RepID=A0A1U6GTA6_9SPHN|nr:MULTISPECIES: SDR family oxidoreductase [Novosphingobium]CDO37543.1 putative Short-chain dehydrogenase [Novosphingobium sp. KN65.2]SLJ86759.1 3-oxoacyl-[acyl-carrier protein] reductase/meso-butanediol dehydrogenase / (S,S)-butanediol dehydrogenase / diacetyl reductase [Novosphingobium mathurense]
MTDGRVLLIAGGSGSIGSAIAREALAQGWKVAVHGRSEDKVHAVVAGLSEQGTIDGFIADIWEDEAAETLVAEVAEHFGRIDAVIDCTATGPLGITGLFPDTSPETFTDFLDVSVGWFERLTHASYGFLAQEGGTIIAFVSDAGIHAARRQSLVGAARAATIGFIRNFAVEAAHDGIRAHAISPSYVAGTDTSRRRGTEFMSRIARRAGLGLPEPEDIAPIALFLCSDGARKITGQVISINGGMNA